MHQWARRIVFDSIGGPNKFLGAINVRDDIIDVL
jgi:hypothetical protein